MSTEHDFLVQTEQLDSRHVEEYDRSNILGLCFQSSSDVHRSDWVGDEDTAVMIRDAVESLVEFRVDVAIWGHFVS